MKNIIILLIGVTILTGCTGIKSVTTGLENESFLLFIANQNSYNGGVDVKIDDLEPFKAEVTKDNSPIPKGKVYAISTGKHLITVSSKNQVIFKKQVFISSQETKKIMLP